MRTVLDVETNILNKGNPFSQEGKLVCVGLKPLKESSSILWDTFDEINCPDFLIGFNIKFDLHWVRKAKVIFPNNLRVWDCQLAHYLLTGQSKPYPSLDEVAEYYGLPKKLDIVKTEYWDKGMDTDQIPQDILTAYLEQDLLLTELVYFKQIEDFSKVNKNLFMLFMLQCADLLVLADMEFNGMLFDTAQAATLLETETAEIAKIEQELQTYFPDTPINWDSRDHLSCCLYGGSIIHTNRVPIGYYATGLKKGLPRYKLVEIKYELPQMVRPPKGSGLKKDGYYATDEPTLRSITGSKHAKRFIDLLLRRAEKSKLCNTYYRGIPELIEEMDWPTGRIHGQFNQCVARTGRLSSSKPNLQNFAGEVDKLLITEYAD